MKKHLKRFLYWFIGIILAFILAGFLVVVFFEKPIGNQLVRAVNRSLKTELKIEAFQLSLFSGFPDISAEMVGVTLGDALGGNLLEAEKLAFRFSLISLFTSDIKVETILIENGRLNIVQADRRGRNNYSIFSAAETETDDPAAEEKALGLSLEKAYLSNVQLAYLDVPAGQKIVTEIKEGSVSGTLEGMKLGLWSESNMRIRGIELDGQRYLVGQSLSYEVSVDLDLENQRYSFDQGEMVLGGHRFVVTGWLEQKDTYREMDVSIIGKEGNLTSMLTLLPADTYAPFTRDVESDGLFSFEAKIQGRQDQRRNPTVTVTFGLKDGRIEAGVLGSPLKDVQLEARYSSGKYGTGRSSTFELTRFEAFLERRRLTAALSIKNFDDPQIDFQIDGIIPLHLIYKALGNPYLTDGGGDLEFQNVRIRGNYRDMVDVNRIARVTLDGGVVFDDAFVAIDRDRLFVDRGSITIQNNNLAIDDLRLEGPGTDLIINGDVSNLLPVLFSETRKGDPKSTLRFHATLEAESLDLDRMMVFSTIPFEEGEVEQEVYDSLKEVRLIRRANFMEHLTGTFESTIRSFNYRLIEGRYFKGHLSFDGGVMKVDGDTKAMGGNFLVNGSAYFTSLPRLELKLICDGVDIKEFFRQTENFGQDVLVSENLKGRLESKMAIYANWDQEGNFQQEKLRVLADVRLEDGELVDVEMLYNFTDFLKLKDLRRINVQTLQNWMEIEGGVLHIPVMFIQSNALNLTISGKHGFNDEIEYNFKVNAGQVLANKIKTHDPTLDPLPARRTGFFNLYYKLWGTLDTYEIRSSRRRILSEFEETERQKQRIKSKLVAEFGPIINLDEPVNWQDEIPEFEGEPTDSGDPEFLDDF